MNKKKVAAGCAAILMVAPAFVFAQSASTSVGVSTDVQTQIQSLLSQIQGLQQQLTSLLASSTIPEMHDMEHLMASSSMPLMGRHGDEHGNVPCVALSRNLSIGSMGDDVKQLQDMLAQDPDNDFTASTTGFFGPMTAKALVHFQMRFGIASSSSGFVGPLTRHFFKEHCGGSDNGIGNDGMDNGEHNGNGEDGNGVHGGVMIRIVSGTISGSDSSSITVQREGGNTVTVNINASTTIMVASTSSAPVAGTTANLTTGAHVTVEGHNSSNGSIDATRITVGTGLVPEPMENDDENEGIGMPASSTPGNLVHSLLQFFDPFKPHNDDGQGQGN